MFKIIEGDYAAQSPLYLKKGYMVPKSVVGIIDGKELVKYPVRDCFLQLEEISSDKKSHTVKILTNDGKTIIARVDKATFDDMKIQVSLGPDPAISGTPMPERQSAFKAIAKGGGLRTKDETQKRHPINLVVVGFTIFALIWMVSEYGGSSHSNGGTGKEISDLDNATKSALITTHCKPEIIARLRAPSSADFPWSTKAVQVSTDKLSWSSHVDAQNGFGAAVRSNFTCTIKFLGGDVGDYKRWAFDNLMMQ